MSCRAINVLGSTGSVGTATLDIIAHHQDRFRIVGLTAYSNAELLIIQARMFRPKAVAIGDHSKLAAVEAALSDTGIRVFGGDEGIAEIARLPCDMTIAAIVGMAGLRPILTAIENSRILAIANKEPLVAAGALVLSKAQQHDVRILPLDSEHNAIFQVLDERHRPSVKRLILTASGGPFRGMTIEQMQSVTREQALKHPNWSMGAKITIDSATMMNKALEIIEAHYLFAVPPEQIDVLIHPQSIVHSMVEYEDGSTLAQMGAPDMRTPIAYALGWPERLSSSSPPINWADGVQLDFQPPDTTAFPALPLAYEALSRGTVACIALNAANEVAVQAFLDGRIAFTEIVETVTDAVRSDWPITPDTIENIITLDQFVRAWAGQRLVRG